MKNYLAEVELVEFRRYKVRIEAENKPTPEQIRDLIVDGKVQLEKMGFFHVGDMNCISVKEFYPGEEHLI